MSEVIVKNFVGGALEVKLKVHMLCYASNCYVESYS